MQKKALFFILAFFACLPLLSVLATAANVKPMDLAQVTVKDNLSYHYASAYNAYVHVSDGKKHGLLDCDGNEVIPVIYDSLKFVSNDLVAVGQNLDNNVKTGEKNTGVDKYGLMDLNGNWVVPLRYNRIDPFYEDMAAVYLDNKSGSVDSMKLGFIDRTGKEVIPPIYVAALAGLEDWPDEFITFPHHTIRAGFSDGVVRVWKDGVTYILDKQGQVLLTKNVSAGFCDGRALVHVFSGNSYNFKSGYMDKQGNMVIPAIYDEAHDFSEGYAIVGKRDSSGKIRYGAIDQAGNVVVPIIYYGMTPFHEGMARVYEKDEANGLEAYKFGFVNTNGKLIVPMIYSGASNYSDGLAVVSIKDERFKDSEYDSQRLYGSIDKQGNVIIPLEYCAPFEFNEGIAYVCKGYPSSPFSPPGNSNYFEEFCKSMRELGTAQECSCIDTSGKTIISFGDRGKNYWSWGNIFSGKIGAYEKSDGQYAIIRNPLYEEQAKAAFPDVPTGEWYAVPVAWAVEQDITNGTGIGKFSPTQNCTHAQILTFLYRANRGEGAATAEDMNKAISWAREKGMIDSSFNGNTFCTRAEAVNHIWQALNKPSAAASNFTDMEGYEQYAKAVDWANEKKITTGVGNNMFAPGDTCNRAYIVTFLYRAYNN